LAILTQEYEIEICVINTQCGGRIDYFGEDRHYPHRVFLLYNNLHYDPGKTFDPFSHEKTSVNAFALVYSVTYDVGQQKELIQTKFHRNDEAVMALAKDLVDQFISSPTTAPSTGIGPSATLKKHQSNSKSESHVMHVKL
jgi:hypothetical protein